MENYDRERKALQYSGNSQFKFKYNRIS